SIEPSDTKALQPTPSGRPPFSSAVSGAPLWLRKPTFPRGTRPPARVALRPVRGQATPRQPGPSTRSEPPRSSPATCRHGSAQAPGPRPPRSGAGGAAPPPAGRHEDRPLDPGRGTRAEDPGDVRRRAGHDG